VTVTVEPATVTQSESSADEMAGADIKTSVKERKNSEPVHTAGGETGKLPTPCTGHK
jgi:hypothetical protein